MNATITKGSLLLLLFTAVLFSSCKEDEIDTFSGETNVYFSLQRWGRSYTLTNFPLLDPISKDTTLYSFTWSNTSQSYDSLFISLALEETSDGYRPEVIPVSISGNVTDYDRPLKYVIEEASTAVEGSDFEVSGAFIPAGRNIGGIALMLKREAFNDKTLTLYFRLLPNEHFQTNYTSIKRSSSSVEDVNLQEFSVHVSGFLGLPKNWTTLVNYFGPFSRKKIYLILEVTGGSIFDLYPPNNANQDISLIMGYSAIFKSYLAAQKANGTPVLEDDGSEMRATLN